MKQLDQLRFTVDELNKCLNARLSSEPTTEVSVEHEISVMIQLRKVICQFRSDIVDPLLGIEWIHCLHSLDKLIYIKADEYAQIRTKDLE